MTFDEVCEQALEMLLCRRRVSYRALEVQFQPTTRRGSKTYDLQEAKALLEDLETKGSQGKL